jgi:peptide/nickel transport system substrate-binding protein/oligopeptide transport system substrate-binding protein
MRTKFVFMAFLLFALGCSKKQESLGHFNGVTYSKGVYSLPETLDPIKMTDTASLLVSNLIYAGLLKISPDLHLKADLAESWAASEDGKTYTFTLKQNAKFHDGTAITALAVVQSLTRTVSERSTVYNYYDCIKGADEYHSGKADHVSGLKALSDHLVSIELKYPFPPFLSVLAGATAKILPQKIDAEFFKSPIGSGPFQFVSLKRDSAEHGEMILKRFDGYLGTKPTIENLILKARIEKDAIAEASKGEIDDLASYPLPGSEPVFKSGQDITAPIAATWIIGLNARKAPFNNIKIRQAFKAAVDSEAFRKAFYPDAVAATSYIPNGLQGYLEKEVPVFKSAHAITKAKIEIAFPAVLSHEKEMREFLEKNLRAQGWNVVFKPMNWDDLMAAYNKKSLQGFLLSMNMDYPDTEFLVRNFESTNPDNFSGLKNKEIDQLIQSARATEERGKRGGLYQSIISKIEDQAVTVNLFYPRSHNWVSRCVKGLVPNILADYYIDYSTVEVDQDCKNQTGGKT